MRLREPAPTAHLLVDDFEGDSTERLAGRVKAPAVADPDPDDVLLYIYALSLRRRLPKGATDPNLILTFNGNPRQTLFWVKAGKWHAARLEPDRKRLLFRKGGCVRAERDKDGFQFYVRVYHLRKWVLLLPLALCALLLCLSLSLCSPSGSPDFLSGMTGTAGATSKPVPVVSVDYAAYDATVDSVWKADTLTQDFRLSLPATCQYAKGKQGGNPILSSPSLMVDFNHDGKYSDSECVYNPAGKDGYGAFLRPGTEVNRIRLTQSVPAGTYSARTVWNSVLASDGKTPAGSTSFDFILTVE